MAPPPQLRRAAARPSHPPTTRRSARLVATVLGLLLRLVFPAAAQTEGVLFTHLGGFNTTGFGEGVTVTGSLAYPSVGADDPMTLDLRVGRVQVLDWHGVSGETLALGTVHPLSIVSSSGLPVTVSLTGPAEFSGGTLTVTNFGMVTVTAEQAGDDAHLPIREERRFNVPVTVLERLGGFDTSGRALAVEVAGDRAYVANGAAGLQILDVSNPASPIRLGSFETGGSAVAVQVEGSLAYLATLYAGFQIIDVSNPASPVRVGSYDTGVWVTAMQVAGQFAYLVGEPPGVVVLDVSNPAAPVRVGGLALPGEGFAVQVVGNLVYVSDQDAGFVVLDVTNPAMPVQRGSFNGFAGVPAAFQVVDGLAYLAYASAGLIILDVRDPAAPTFLGQLPSIPFRSSVQVAGNYAFVAARDLGVEVIDVSNPASPMRLTLYETAGGAYAAQRVGNRVFVADETAGLLILDFRAGQPQALHWELPSALTYQGPLTLGGTASTGFPVTYSVPSGPGAVQGNQLNFSGIGRVVVRAEQAGDANYAPVAVDRVITVGLPQLGARPAGDAAEVFWASGLAGLELQGRETLDAATPWREAGLPWTEVNSEVRVNPSASPLRYFRLQGFSGQVEPLAVTGWNRDVVLENQPVRRAQAMDSFGAAWFENGLGGRTNGLPADRQIISQLDTTVLFELRPYSSSNVLWLNNARRTNSLVLTTPTACSSLHVLAHSANGGGNGALFIHYADGSTSEALPFFAPDWWDGSPSAPTRRPAIRGLARSRTAGALFTYDPVPPGFSLHQTDFDLTTGPHTGKVITRLEFVKGTSPEATGIFAVSGIAIAPSP
ncbi:MAG: hypothetical protein KF791_07395 [Verrucomicrobiae bacterium]|nr:hypothetical protein [Verrucomicrobiae bacterium]